MQSCCAVVPAERLRHTDWKTQDSVRSSWHIVIMGPCQCTKYNISRSSPQTCSQISFAEVYNPNGRRIRKIFFLYPFCSSIHLHKPALKSVLLKSTIPMKNSRVPDQNGVSWAWYIVEIHHSGRYVKLFYFSLSFCLFLFYKGLCFDLCLKCSCWLFLFFAPFFVHVPIMLNLV